MTHPINPLPPSFVSHHLGKCCYICEPDPLQRKVAREAIDKLFLQTKEFTDLTTCHNALGEDEPDLIVVDLDSSPHPVAAYHTLRTAAPGTLLVLTGLMYHHRMSLCVATDPACAAYLEKPFARSALQGVVAASLARRSYATRHSI